MGERLTADLSRVAVQVVDPTEPLVATTAGFDLLVNLSYRDHGRCGAARGVYVVHFPDQPGGELRPWQRALVRSGRRWARPSLRVDAVRGLHRSDLIRWQEVHWTNGHGVLRVHGQAGGVEPITLWFGRYVPGGPERQIGVLVDGEVVAEGTLSPPRSKRDLIDPFSLDIVVPGRPGGALVEIHSDSDVAHEVLGNGDRRRLGVPLVAVTRGHGWRRHVLGRASLLAADPTDTTWLDSYDRIVANSPFTQRWIERWWGRTSTVLEPPVRLREPAAKDPIILSVGRFFAPGRGHAKKQREMVDAFARLVRTGLAPGWELHLVGGCDPHDHAYLDEVRAAAEGLAVTIHIDASGAELDALYRRASVYWHATGLGEDVDADPVRAEHFGITTVEAMSAGAVPVVMAAGGQPDIVRDGHDGFVFRDLDGLVAVTAQLVGDPDLRREMSRAAIARAQEFGFERFAERVQALVAPLLEPEASDR
nr:glycosyltransferase family 4 protein [Rhabdothermincola salaria]